jgi:hypothetical protein
MFRDIVSAYLDTLRAKVEAVRSAAADTPKIGIFWLHLKDGKVVVFDSYKYELEFGQDYGDFVIAKEEHYNYWNSLKQHGYAPKNSEYEDLPRGRVAYNRVTKKYVVFVGKWINAVPGIKNTITAEFKLKKSNTEWQQDWHYNEIKRWGF